MGTVIGFNEDNGKYLVKAQYGMVGGKPGNSNGKSEDRSGKTLYFSTDDIQPRNRRLGAVQVDEPQVRSNCYLGSLIAEVEKTEHRNLYEAPTLEHRLLAEDNVDPFTAFFG